MLVFLSILKSIADSSIIISVEWWVVIATAGTAIGTILAAIVAIFGISLKKPKLTIEFQETLDGLGVYWGAFSLYVEEKDMETDEVNQDIFDYTGLLVFVKNKGKKVAKNCQLKWQIREIAAGTPKPPFELSAPVSIIYDGVVMPKMGSRHFRPPCGNEIFTNIASGSREAFNLIYYLKQDGKCHTYNYIGFDIEKDKKYEIRLTAYADDAFPVTKTYEFSWDGTQDGLTKSLKLE